MNAAASSHPILPRLRWVWLLPFFLLFAQYGEYRHELSHYTQNAPASKKQAPVGNDSCGLCLAYGHLSGVAKPEAGTAPLLADLAFHHAPERALNHVAAALPAARNRGPPIV